MFNAIREITMNPDKGLWFLWTLGICTFFASLPEFIKPGEYRIIKYLFIFGILMIPWAYFPGIKLCRIYWPFYALGICLVKWKNIFYYKSLKIAVWICVSLYPIFVALWIRNDNPLFYDAIVGVILKKNKYMILWEIFCLIYRIYFVPFLGVVFLMKLWHIIRIHMRRKTFCGFLGRHTMEIYVMQWYFMSIIRTGIRIVDSVMTFWLALLLPLAIGMFFRDIPIISYFTLGVTGKKLMNGNKQ